MAAHADRAPSERWIQVRKGIETGTGSGNFVRIDSVWVEIDGKWWQLGGSVVCVYRNSHRMWRTVFKRTIIDGVRPMWLLRQNGLAGLAELKKREAGAEGGGGMKVGISVDCAVCGRQKKPRGRSAPMTLVMCEPGECSGYFQPPLVGDLWPGETEEEFGYPVSAHGTREAAA